MQGFNRGLSPNQALEAETVDYRTRWGSDASRDVLELRFLYAIAQGCAAEADQPNPGSSETGRSRLMRDGDPYLVRELRANLVHL